MRFLSWIVMIPVAALLVAFALNNRGPVSVDLWPAPYAVDIPIYLIVFAGTLFGLIIGAVWSWLATIASRARATAKRRARARAAAAAEAESASIESAISDAAAEARVPARIEARP